MQKEVVYLGSKKFNGNKTLASILETEISNDRMAWYVDYFTEDPDQFDVSLLATDPDTGISIRMTNENKEQRDPSDPENGQWGGEDVTNWFFQDVPGADKIEHRWIFTFTSSSGENWGLHVEANRIFCFGPNALSLTNDNLWDLYVEEGIAGPLKASLVYKASNLHAIVIDPDLYGTLDKVGLVQEYMLALVGILD